MELTDIELDNFLWMARNTESSRDEIITKIKTKNLNKPESGQFLLTYDLLEIWSIELINR